ncbi:hypothetical protein GZH46_00835, partial [Fragariocoptes setiger]
MVEPKVFKSHLTVEFDENDVSLGDFILRSLDKFSDTELFVDCASGRKWTGAAMSQQVRRLATRLIVELDMRPGDISCISYDHCDRTVALALAIICAGGTVSCAYPHDPYPELLYLARKTRPAFLFCARDRSHWGSQLHNDLGNAHSLKAIVSMDNGELDIDFETLWIQETNSPEPTREMPQLPLAPYASINEMLAFMSLSSGTTGLPKVIASTHANCLATSKQMSVSRRDRAREVPGDTDQAASQTITLSCSATLD